MGAGGEEGPWRQSSRLHVKEALDLRTRLWTDHPKPLSFAVKLVGTDGENGPDGHIPGSTIAHPAGWEANTGVPPWQLAGELLFRIVHSWMMPGK
jgi:hypothetical protein